MKDDKNSMYDILCSMSGTQVINIFTDVYGMKILDDNVRDELISQGYLKESRMRKTFRIAEYETEEGCHLFDVFDTEDNDNALETFMTEEQARDYVFDTYGKEAIIR